MPYRNERRRIVRAPVGGGNRPPGLQARAEKTLEALRRRYPCPSGSLAASTPWELLAATMLAAQCTDARVNLVTPDFFARWPDPEALARASVAEVEDCIRSTGFFRNKARNLVAAALRVRDVFQGRTPRNLADLVSLPGVGRKTASVVLFGAFGLAEGLAVDTHVGRIAFRLGLASSRDPVRTERELMDLFPREEWGNLNHRLVLFGREICRARKPACSACEMKAFCRHGKDRLQAEPS